MKFEIEITRQDYFEFNTFNFLKTRIWKTALSAGIGLILTLIILYSKQTHINIVELAVVSILFIALYCLLTYRSLNKTRNAPLADGSILGIKLLEFTEDGIRVKDKDSESHLNWGGLKSFDEAKTAFYLYLDTNMAIVIPKRAFKSVIEQQPFVDLIHSKLNAA